MVIPNIAKGMKDWKYTFDPVSREAWIRQIEADLKGKPAESLYREWWPGEPLVPFVHAEDAGAETICLPDSFFSKPPDIVEAVHTTSHNPELINKKILSALRYGAQTVLLYPGVSKPFYKEEWLSGVIPEIIRLHIQVDSPSFKNLPAALQIIPENILLRLARTKTSESLQTLFEPSGITDALKRNRFHFTYTIRSAGNWIEEVSVMLNMILADIKSWEKLGLPTHTFFGKCILSLEADANYFRQIIQSRTLHLLWQNLKKRFSIDFVPTLDQYLETQIQPVTGEKPDHFLIRSSMSGLAAALSGTHALCIHHGDGDQSPEYYERIHRNIHHLLHYESNMYKAKDPLAGAFALQFYTRKWTEEIWRKLV